MPTVEHEYAFDVKLFAVVRIKAKSEESARTLLNEALSCANIDWKENNVNITEASLTTDDGEPLLFEIDGEETEDA